MSRHKNRFNHSYSGGLPLGVGDRYWAQDVARDHRYLQGLAAQAVADLLGVDSGVLLRGGAVTADSPTAISISAASGLCDFDVSVPDDSVAWAVPAAEATATIKVRVDLPAQSGLSLAALGATLDGSTVNYLKLAFAEADVRSRARQYAGGSYAFARGDSFVLTCTPAAPTAYQVLLATVVGSGSATPTIKQKVGAVPAMPAVPKTVVKLHGSGNWIVPEGVTRISVKCVPGGGGGGAGIYDATTGLRHGGGGGAGVLIGNIIPTIKEVTPGQSIAYSAGAGGLGTNVEGVAGDGGNTTFGDIIGYGCKGAQSLGMGGRANSDTQNQQSGGCAGYGSRGGMYNYIVYCGGSGGGAGGQGGYIGQSDGLTGGYGGGGGGGGMWGNLTVNTNGGSGGTGEIIIEY